MNKTILIIIALALSGLLGCGLSPATPSDYITLDQVDPEYNGDDADLMWEYCSHPEYEPLRSLCGLCHTIY